MVIGPDPVDLTHSPRTETRPRTIGDAEIHRDANERNIETAEFLLVRRIEQGGDPGVRQLTLSPGTKEARGGLLEGRIKNVIALGVLIFLSESCEFVSVHRLCPLLPDLHAERLLRSRHRLRKHREI